MRVGGYQSIAYEQAAVTPRMKHKPEIEDFSSIIGETDSEIEKAKVNSSSSNIQVKDRFRSGYWTPEDKNGKRDWIAEQEEIDKYAKYYDGNKSPLGILKRLERTSTEVKSNDSSPIWEELREQYDIRNATFYELCNIANKLFDAGEISFSDNGSLTSDRDMERAWRDQVERYIDSGDSVEEILACGVRIKDLVNSGVRTEKLVEWGIKIEEIEKFKRTEEHETERISQLYLSMALALDKNSSLEEEFGTKSIIREPQFGKVKQGQDSTFDHTTDEFRGNVAKKVFYSPISFPSQTQGAIPIQQTHGQQEWIA